MKNDRGGTRIKAEKKGVGFSNPLPSSVCLDRFAAIRAADFFTW
ncbi:MAG: hypothetical protein ACLRUN_09630 [Christensenellales bacterium]